MAVTNCNDAAVNPVLQKPLPAIGPRFFFFLTGISSICSVVFIATEPLFAKDKLLAQDPIVRQLSGTLKLLYSV